MYHRRFILCLMMITIALPACSAQSPESNRSELTQIATIDSLLAGNFDGDMPIGTLKTLGNFGIGTFNGLDGEMIARNGVFYQSDEQAKIHPVPDSLSVPFASVTFFKPNSHFSAESVTSFDSVQSLIDRHIQTPNIYYAVMMEGQFATLRIRSVPRQSKPYRRMADFITEEQKILEFGPVRGWIVGFRSPSYVKGIGITGYHFHFISEDQTIGGHVLSLSIDRAEISLQEIRNFRMILPRTESFDSLSFDADRTAELQKVER